MAKKTKKILVSVGGFSVLFVGVLLIFLPGPAMLVIPVGLGILATEFAWARKALQSTKDKTGKWLKRLKPEKRA